MIRKLILAVAVLVMAAVPMSALARDDHRDGRHEFERRESRPFFFGVYPEPYSVYAPRCYWQPGHWANQPYVDANGDYAYVSQWVPPQQVCH
jgi:hypothetical protein